MAKGKPHTVLSEVGNKAHKAEKIVKQRKSESFTAMQAHFTADR